MIDHRRTATLSVLGWNLITVALLIAGLAYLFTFTGGDFSGDDGDMPTLLRVWLAVCLVALWCVAVGTAVPIARHLVGRRLNAAAAGGPPMTRDRAVRLGALGAALGWAVVAALVVSAPFLVRLVF